MAGRIWVKFFGYNRGQNILQRASYYSSSPNITVVSANKHVLLGDLSEQHRCGGRDERAQHFI